MEEKNKKVKRKKRIKEQISIFTIILWIALIATMTVVTINGISRSNALEGNTRTITLKIDFSELLENLEIKEAEEIEAFMERYIDVFKLELEIITQLSKIYSNLNILFSFIKDTEELQKCIDVLKELGFENKYGIMAEIPSVIIDIENFIDMGISNITIGVNDLTTLVLGTYRTSGFHDCNHEAVLKCIERCVKVTRGTNISVSVGGYVNRDLLNNCKKIGVDYFIVTYPLLNEILNVPLKKLEYINQLDEIKRKTKRQRNKELIKKYQKIIIESGQPLDKRYR